MKQFTTQTLVFNLPGHRSLLDAAKVLSVYIVGNCALDFGKEDVQIDGETIAVPLTQGQTGALGPGNIKVEITIGMEDGSTFKTNTIRTSIEEALRKETL